MKPEKKRLLCTNWSQWGLVNWWLLWCSCQEMLRPGGWTSWRKALDKLSIHKLLISTYIKYCGGNYSLSLEAELIWILILALLVHTLYSISPFLISEWPYYLYLTFESCCANKVRDANYSENNFSIPWMAAIIIDQTSLFIFKCKLKCGCVWD